MFVIINLNIPGTSRTWCDFAVGKKSGRCVFLLFAGLGVILQSGKSREATLIRTMDVNLLVTLLFSFMWQQPFIGSCLGGVILWEHRPGIVKKCVGDDVPFTWDYRMTSDSVNSVQWFKGSGESLMFWDKILNSMKTYFGYEGRVEVLPNTNAGLILKKVSKADSGDYLVELGGPGERDVATLNVYNSGELRPALQIDKQYVTFGTIVNKYGQTQVTINVSTIENMDADIEVTVDGAVSATCKGSVCATDILLNEDRSPNITVQVVADYHICDPFTELVYIETGRDVLSDGYVLAVASVSVLAVLTASSLVVVVVVWFVIRKKQKNGARLTPRQLQYIECPLFYKLNKCPGWEHTDGKADRPLSAEDGHCDDEEIHVEVHESTAHTPVSKEQNKGIVQRTMDAMFYPLLSLYNYMFVTTTRDNIGQENEMETKF